MVTGQPTVFNSLQQTTAMQEHKFTEHMRKLSTKWELLKNELNDLSKSNFPFNLRQRYIEDQYVTLG
jgi:hypothetical protein